MKVSVTEGICQCMKVSVSAWRRCDMLSTSGFIDDVMFVLNGQEYATRKRRYA